MSATATFRDLHLSYDDGHTIAYSADADLTVKSSALMDFEYRGGSDGLLAIRFNVDGENIDIVGLDTRAEWSEVATLNRAITLLAKVRRELVETFGREP